MSTKNARRNVRHQKNAEKKHQKQQQRKVNRLTANVKKAQEAKKNLYDEFGAGHVEYEKEQQFSPKTHQLFGVYVKDGEILRMVISIAKQTCSDDYLEAVAEGMSSNYHDREGVIALRFPPYWSVERVKRMMNSTAWSLFALQTIEGFELDELRFYNGEDYAQEVGKCVDEFCGWIGDCGEAPFGNTVVVDVDSSAIKRVAYNWKTRDMFVTFQSGSVYNYSDVPRKRFTSLVTADSVGRYFQFNVRDDYAYKRVA